MFRFDQSAALPAATRMAPAAPAGFAGREQAPAVRPLLVPGVLAMLFSIRRDPRRACLAVRVPAGAQWPPRPARP